MQIILRILKEVGIAIVLLGLLLLIGYFLFKNQVPFLNSDIPNAVEYKGIDYAEYNIEGDLENQKDPTKRYETTTNNLRVIEIGETELKEKFKQEHQIRLLQQIQSLIQTCLLRQFLLIMLQFQRMKS